MFGTRLLEALVQIQVLHLEGDKFITQSLSIEELMRNLERPLQVNYKWIGGKTFSKHGSSYSLSL